MIRAEDRAVALTMSATLFAAAANGRSPGADTRDLAARVAGDVAVLIAAVDRQVSRPKPERLAPPPNPANVPRGLGDAP
jgi:hypothetical protein